MNPIADTNNAIVTLHLNNEECGSELFPPHGKLHGDDASGLHWVAPHAFKRHVGLHELIILLSELLEQNVHHQVDGSIAVDKHLADWLPIDVAPNVQWLQVLT
jgi:hypothetical protein